MSQFVGITTPTPIPQLQGSAAESPFVGKEVMTSGMVTAIQDSPKYPGFFLQDLAGDANDATSDALFVSTANVPEADRTAYLPGRKVQVAGTVAESNGLTTVVAAPRGIKAGRSQQVAAKGAELSLPTAVPLDLPANVSSAQGYLEAREGMLATVDSALVIGPSSKYGDYTVVDEVTHGPKRDFDHTEAGRRLLISGSIGPKTTMMVGDRVTGISGPVTQLRSGDFQLLQTRNYTDVTRAPYPPRQWGDLDNDDHITPADITAIKARSGQAAGGPLDPADLNGDGKVSATDVTQATARMNRRTGGPAYRIATFNAENFFDDVNAPPPTTDDVPTRNEFNAKLARLAGAIRGPLERPDILAMVEVENTAVLDALIKRPELKDLGYKYALLPTTGRRSINPAILYRGDKVELNNLRQAQQQVPKSIAPGHHETTDIADGVTDGTAPLFAREPLIADVTVKDGDSSDNFTLVVNHLISKFSPGGKPTDPTREEQGRFLNKLVGQLRTDHPDNEVVLVGDLNDTAGSRSVRAIAGPAHNPMMINTTAKLVPKGERYSYVFKGASELIDHMLVTPGMTDRVEGAGVRHFNADLPSAGPMGTGPWGASDHDSPYLDVRFPHAAKQQAATGAAALTATPSVAAAPKTTTMLKTTAAPMTPATPRTTAKPRVTSTAANVSNEASKSAVKPMSAPRRKMATGGDARSA